jgi:hypothetical protein
MKFPVSLKTPSDKLEQGTGLSVDPQRYTLLLSNKEVVSTE